MKTAFHPLGRRDSSLLLSAFYKSSHVEHGGSCKAQTITAIIQKRKVTVLEADKKHVLSIDLETYSDVDLGNCGVYRYVEGDFHILLFAYAFDDEDVQVVDMACGETLPKRVVDAIFDS